MLEKISIIADIEKNSVKLFTMGSKTYAHHWLVAKPPITVKHFRSAEPVYNFKT